MNRFRAAGRVAACAVAFAAASFLAPGACAWAQPGPPVDLSRVFDTGVLVIDTNGDSLPDAVNAALLTGSVPSTMELRAAAEVAARIGFETMALDLPVSRELGTQTVAVVIGRRALSRANPGFAPDTATLTPGEGRVVVRESGGRTWVLLLGGDDDGLESAARVLAGAIPHTRTLSSPHLDDVREGVRGVLDRAGITAVSIELPEARVTDPSVGLDRVIVEVAVDRVMEEQAIAAVREQRARNAVPASEAPGDSLRLEYAGVDTVEVRVNGRRGADAVAIPVAPPPPPAGPVAGRPGSGAKGDLDLSNIYTPAGLLGDGDNNLIPDRVDAVLVPGDSASDRLPDLAARLGLESTGLTVPLTRSAATISEPASQPTMVLIGRSNPLIDRLADSGLVAVDSLGEGEGLIQVVPDAFGSKSALVVTGHDGPAADRAARQIAETFPHLQHRGRDRPTVDDVEEALWRTLSGHDPAGQAAIGLYKLDQIVTELAGRDLESVDVLLSVEKPDSGLAERIEERAARLGADEVRVTLDNRDVQTAPVLIDEEWTVPSEVDRFWAVFRERVLPVVQRGRPITIEARLSEPPAVRQRLAEAARRELLDRGAEPSGTRVTVLSAFKQGFSWLDEVVRPQLTGREIGEIVIRFRRNDPPPDWPQQAMNTPVRWLHEIFPIDEILARELHVDLDRIRFEMVESGPTYEVQVQDGGGNVILADTFEPRWVLRPYFDRFQDYEQVRVTTGWIEARDGDDVVVSERIVTDPEWFWDRFQSRTLPAVYDYVMDRHEGNPRGGSQDAPFFGELTVELEMSEPNYRLNVDNEIISPMDAIHEEVYFGTIEFFQLLGRNARGQNLTYPGRVIPIMRPRGDGRPGTARIRFTGFATSRPAVVVRYRDRTGAEGERRLDIPKVTMERPSARAAHVRVGQPGLTRLDLRVRVDSEHDERARWLQLAPAEQVDARMISAEQVAATLRELEALRAAGMYRSALAFPGLGEIVVNAGWTHEDGPEARRTVVLAPNGVAPDLPNWRHLLPTGWTYDGERIVQWQTPIPPPEGNGILARMAATFDEAEMYRVGESYLGKTIWAMDLMPPIHSTHWSHAKATTFKPTVIYSARQHANEVSSTSHVLRHAELLLTDPDQQKKLDRVNVVIHPFTNPDGAQLAYDLYTMTPDFILHAGYLGSLGMDATSDGDEDFPIYPESKVRNRLWNTWLPDIFLNPHGYPSHQVVQLFSEYTGLVRRGRVTERNWGFNKGWFMPGFGYVDDPRYPRHKDAAFRIRDYITRGINSNRDVFDMNQRNYARYRRYGAAFDQDVFRLPLVDSVMIEMPLKGSPGRTGGPGFNPRVTIWSGTTEAPDETAHGAWMELVAKAGLSWDQAILDYLYEGNHVVERTGSTFFGGVTLKMNRPRPPKANGPAEPATPPGAAPN